MSGMKTALDLSPLDVLKLVDDALRAEDDGELDAA